MELTTIIGVVVVVVIGVLLLKLIGKMLSFAISILGIMLIVWGIVIGLRYFDTQDLRQNLADSDNLFVLQDSGNIVTGFATDGTTPQINQEDLKSDSDLFNKYYKVIVVDKDRLPEKTSLLVDASEGTDKLELFKSYVNNNILSGDPVANLIALDKEGDIKVYEETLAFRHGVSEVLHAP